MLYENIEHRTELKLSGHLPNWTMSNLFWDLGLFSSFFSLIENEILKQVSWQVATEQPNKVSSEIASEASLRNYINRPLSEQPRAYSDVLSDALSGEGRISYCNQVLWLCHP